MKKILPDKQPVVFVFLCDDRDSGNREYARRYIYEDNAEPVVSYMGGTRKAVQIAGRWVVWVHWKTLRALSTAEMRRRLTGRRIIALFDAAKV